MAKETYITAKPDTASVVYVALRLWLVAVFAFYSSYVPVHLATGHHSFGHDSFSGVIAHEVSDVHKHSDSDHHDHGDHSSGPHSAIDHSLNLSQSSQYSFAIHYFPVVLSVASFELGELKQEKILPEILERDVWFGESPPGPKQPGAPPITLQLI